jgi:hypothetical protein
VDLNRLIGMLTRMFVRSAVKTGVSVAARKGKAEGKLTPEERARAKGARAMTQKAQRAARIGRRFFK